MDHQYKNLEEFERALDAITIAHEERVQAIRRRTRLMVWLVIVLGLVAVFSGCSTMTPRQKTVARAVVFTVVATSLAASCHHGHGPVGHVTIPEPPCFPQQDGTCR